MIYRLFILKRILEDVFIWPFILWGRFQARKTPLNEEYDIYFLFPFYHIGGAEKVHYLIAQAFRDRKALIFFTRKSQDQGFRQAFMESGHKVVDLSPSTDNKWAYWNNLIMRGRVSGHINNQQKKPVVFNGQCNFAYKLSPWLDPDIPQIELIHSYSSFSWIRIPFISFYTKTVMISKVRIDDHLHQYNRLGVPEELNERIIYIINGIELPEETGTKDYTVSPLEILYVGRGTSEKRVHLIAAIAERCRLKGIVARFSFAGSVKDAVPQQLQGSCHFMGNLSDPSKLGKVYEQSHLLIMASDTEGFPMAVMEAMSHGMAVLSTAVGDIPVHIKEGINGYLIAASATEEEIIEQSVEIISKLSIDRGLLKKMGENNSNYARANFGIGQFNLAYRKLFATLTIDEK
jgi:L-malate glycosyltransferase